MRLALAFLIGLAAPAAAQQACDTRDATAALLAGKYGERIVGNGLTPSGELAELWANPASGSWSFTFTRSDGTTCLMAFGEGFSPDALLPVVVGDPA